MENNHTTTGAFTMVAKTFQGLEEVLAQELLLLGAKNVEIGSRMVQFEGDLKLMYQANLCCRTALRILKPIAKFTADDADELYDRVRDFDWTQYLSPEKTFAIDATVNGTRFTHSQYAAYRVKDGIADFFTERMHHRPSVRLENADVLINVHIADNRITLSLDSSGAPLSKRGYKTDNTEAPINEVLAAGIILMTGWRGDVDFMDPMCGSGTFLTEAALIAANINPGIYREGFAFEKWDDFDSELFESLYNDDSGEREVHVRISGSDIDPKAVAIATANIKNARLDNIVNVECKPMSEALPTAPEGILVTNPPYGKRLRPGDMDSLWKRIGSDLKKNFPGWHAWIIGMTDEQFAEIGFKPTIKIPLHNGSLECSLREYVIFSGRYDDYRSQGNSVKESRDESGLEGVTRSKHMNRREWEAETHKYGSKESPRKMREGRDDRGFRKENRGFRKEERGPRKNNKGLPKDHGFRKEERGFRKEDKGFSKYRGFRKEERGGGMGYRKREAVEISGKGPKLTSYSETRFGNGVMRSRRKPTAETETTDE